MPDTDELAERCFEAVPERVLFVGHFHHRLVMRQRGGRVAWEGGGPIRLAPPVRHLVLLGAVLRGWCAIYDTTSAELAPIRCGP